MPPLILLYYYMTPWKEATHFLLSLYFLRKLEIIFSFLDFQKKIDSDNTQGCGYKTFVQNYEKKNHQRSQTPFITSGLKWEK